MPLETAVSVRRDSPDPASVASKWQVRRRQPVPTPALLPAKAARADAAAGAPTHSRKREREGGIHRAGGRLCEPSLTAQDAPGVVDLPVQRRSAADAGQPSPPLCRSALDQSAPSTLRLCWCTACMTRLGMTSILHAATNVEPG